MTLSKKTVLVVVVVIVLAYLAISFYSRFVAYPATREKQENIQQDVEAKIQNLDKTMNTPRLIQSVGASDGDNKMMLWIRNTGKTDINGNDFKVFIDGAPVSSTGCNTVLKPLNFCELKLNEIPFPSRGEKKKVTLTSGSATEDYFCYVDTSPVSNGRGC